MAHLRLDPYDNTIIIGSLVVDFLADFDGVVVDFLAATDLKGTITFSL
jgi:hypothetical protein